LAEAPLQRSSNSRYYQEQNNPYMASIYAREAHDKAVLTGCGGGSGSDKEKDLAETDER